MPAAPRRHRGGAIAGWRGGRPLPSHSHVDHHNLHSGIFSHAIHVWSMASHSAWRRPRWNVERWEEQPNFLTADFGDYRDFEDEDGEARGTPNRRMRSSKKSKTATEKLRTRSGIGSLLVVNSSSACRLPTGDTADYQSALQFQVRSGSRHNQIFSIAFDGRHFRTLPATIFGVFAPIWVPIPRLIRGCSLGRMGT